nr:unnamed protein product [Fasciola hepatica]
MQHCQDSTRAFLESGFSERKNRTSSNNSHCAVVTYVNFTECGFSKNAVESGNKTHTYTHTSTHSPLLHLRLTSDYSTQTSRQNVPSSFCIH